MSFNQVILIGNLGKDPEQRVSKDGNLISIFSIATTDGWGDNKKTNWHNVIAFKKTAEFVNNNFKKGDQILIRGSLEYGKYTDKQGIEKYTTNIVTDDARFVGSGSKDKVTQSKDNKEASDSDIPF